MALAILKVARKELLQQDFEGLMKYFRFVVVTNDKLTSTFQYLIVISGRLIDSEYMNLIELILFKQGQHPEDLPQRGKR